MTELHNLPKGLWFVDQYNRMIRWYQRFQTINNGVLISPGIAEYQYDEILVFFIFCHHLRDWIIQDTTVNKSHPNYKKFKLLKSKISDFIKNNDCMCLCADICNSAKHKHLDKSSNYYEETSVRFVGVHLIETPRGKLYKPKWEILTDSGKRYDLFEVATECKTKWFEFLESQEMQIRELIPFWQEN